MMIDTKGCAILLIGSAVLLFLLYAGGKLIMSWI